MCGICRRTPSPNDNRLTFHSRHSFTPCWYQMAMLLFLMFPVKHQWHFFFHYFLRPTVAPCWRCLDKVAPCHCHHLFGLPIIIIKGRAATVVSLLHTWFAWHYHFTLIHFRYHHYHHHHHPSPVPWYLFLLGLASTTGVWRMNTVEGFLNFALDLPFLLSSLFTFTHPHSLKPYATSSWTLHRYGGSVPNHYQHLFTQ